MRTCPVDPGQQTCRPLPPDEDGLPDETLAQIRENIVLSTSEDDPSSSLDCAGPSGACDPIGEASKSPEAMEAFLRKHPFSFDCLLERVFGERSSR